MPAAPTPAPSRRDPMRAQLPAALAEIDRARAPVISRATDYPPGHAIAPHAHARCQLIHAVQGVMVVAVAAGQWIVPPARALWMPAGVSHAIRCIGRVHMRSVWVRADVPVTGAERPRTVGVSPLLRSLIEAATEVGDDYEEGSRDARLMALLLDELQALPGLPLHLPEPSDPALRRICERLTRRPDDDTTLQAWAQGLGVDAKTLQRRFARETGMSFGQWRQQSRLLHGLELLAGGAKVVEVGLALGYDSPSAFAAMFRRQFGQPPSRFFG